jgi:hypothetical protein
VTTGAVAPSPVGAVELATVPADQLLWDVSVDATGVYYAVAWYPETSASADIGSDTQGAIRRVARDGGESTQLWQGQGAAYGVGAGTAGIYFITYEYKSRGRAGYVWTIPRAGGDARQLDGWRSQGSTIGFAVDGDTIYWGHSAGSGGALNRTNGVDGTTVALVPNVSSPVGLATSGDSAFYVTVGGVFSVPAGGGAPVNLVDQRVADGGWLAVSRPSRTLVASLAGSGVTAIDLAGGRSTTLTDAAAKDVTTDGDFAFWIDAAGGRIAKAPIAGGTPTTVASGLTNPVALAVDDRYVYWVDQGTRQVMRAPKS